MATTRNTTSKTSRRANGPATSKAQTRQEISQAVEQQSRKGKGKGASKARARFEGVELEFTFTKETQGTFRYDLDTESGKPCAFYLLKELLPQGLTGDDMPENVIISIHPDE